MFSKVSLSNVSFLSAIKDICRWNSPENQEDASPDSSDDLFEQMMAYIQDNFTEELYLRDLSDRFFLNFTYCCELFKKKSGMPFSKYLTSLRLEKAANMLLQSQISIETICFECGYNDYSYFNKAFKKKYNLTPFQYRKEGQLHEKNN